jgi:hypothetical protein
MQISACPECDSTAEVSDAGTAGSTHGPIDMVRVLCINRHWFLMPREGLRDDLTEDA